MSLKQRKLFASREFDFKEDGLFVKEKNLTNSSETVISYEDIAINNLRRRSKTDNLIVVVTVLFGLLFIGSFLSKIFGGEADWSVIIMALIFTLFGSLITFINNKQEVIIPLYSSGGFILFERIPTKGEVDKFIAELMLRINTYLKEKYAKIDHDLPIEGQLNNLIYLRERKVIGDDEFSRLKETLLKRKNQSEIGFR